MASVRALGFFTFRVIVVGAICLLAGYFLGMQAGGALQHAKDLEEIRYTQDTYAQLHQALLDERKQNQKLEARLTETSPNAPVRTTASEPPR